MDKTIRRDEFSSLWKTSTPTEIAKRYGVSRAAIYQRARSWGLPPRAEMELPDVESPTEDEIASRAAAIRAKWSDEEHASRMVGVRQAESRWTPPVIEIGMIEPPKYCRI